MAITGECFCGQVRYQIEGSVHDARSCHCSRCRKAFNAQASAYALVDSSNFQWLSGEHLLTYFPTGQGFGLKFCSVCGSTLCAFYDNVIHGVTLGCINGDPHITLTRHLFVGSKASWEIIPDGAPQYLASAPEPN